MKVVVICDAKSGGLSDVTVETLAWCNFTNMVMHLGLVESLARYSKKLSQLSRNYGHKTQLIFVHKDA